MKRAGEARRFLTHKCVTLNAHQNAALLSFTRKAKIKFMPYASKAEIYFIAAMMILILVISAAAVYFFFVTYKKEMREKEKRAEQKLRQKTEKENIN